MLGYEKFGLIGASGVGPYALACAAVIPERLDFVALMESWAPVVGTGLWMDSLSTSYCTADLEAVQDEFIAEHYTEDVREAFRQGVKGPADDAILVYGEWGFDLGEINFPVHIFHGEEDILTPYSFGNTGSRICQIQPCTATQGRDTIT